MAQPVLKGKRFFCREWVFAKLAHCLEARPTSKTCGALLTGGSGCGKTSICCEMVWPTVVYGRQRSLNKRLLAYHFCQSHVAESLCLSSFIRSLVNQIADSEMVPGYREKLKDPDIQAFLQGPQCDTDPDEAFKRAIVFPLLEVDQPKQCCFVLVDSVDIGALPPSNLQSSSTSDRSVNGGSRNLAELLAHHHHLFPQWLVLICSARKQNRGVTRLFTGFRKLTLDDLRKASVVRDVQQYILCRLDKEPALRQHLNRETAEMLDQLHIKSNGCFLYIEKVLDGVTENFINLREIREIPGTLNGLYLWLSQRLFNRKHFHKVQPILNVLLSARYPLTEQELYECVSSRHTNMSLEDFNKRLHVSRKILLTTDDGFVILFHPSYSEWMLDVKHCTQKYLCNIKEGHAAHALWLTSRAKMLTSLEMQDLAHHLVRMPQITPGSIHLPFWLCLCGANIEEALIERVPREAKVNRILQEAGAVVPKVVLDEFSAPEDSPKNDSDDPLLDFLADLDQVDSNGRTLLHSASHEGNVALLAALLSKGSLLEAVDQGGQTALNLAARQGHADAVRMLLMADADPNHADLDGWTALRSAAWGGHTAVVSVLLENGADVDCADSDGRTALRAAAWGGHDDIVAKLISHGAKVNRTDNEGRTALIAAAYMGHTEIVVHLLDNGAAVNHADADGRTALSVAALCVPAVCNDGYAGVVHTLLERGAEVDHRDRDGMTPLLVAAFEGHRDVCELLLEYDADVDHTDNNNRTPLLAAASMGHAEVVSLLLFWGCYVDNIDGEGRTVLSVAAAQGNSDVVKQLLDRGLDEMHRDNAGWTPLHYSAYEGHVQVCELLLDAGSKVNETDNDGRHPLLLSAQEGHVEVVSVLLDHDSPVDHHAHDGKTALRVAALEGHKDIVTLLLCNDADIDYKDLDGRSTLYLLALESKLSMSTYFVACSADLESTDSEGRTPLQVSAWQGHWEMVKMLLNNSAKVDAVDNENRTALQSAAWQGHTAIVKLLLEYNANVDHVCNQGATALCIAAQEGQEECVKLLLEAGANPSHSDRCGRTALKVALKGGHEGVVRILEEYAAARQGASLSTTASVTSGSTAETKPCSALLHPSPGASPESTCENRRSLLSLGNNSSGKSSSNLTSTSKSSQASQGGTHSCSTPNQREGVLPPCTVPSAPPPTGLSFAQQLQQCTRNKHRPSPLAEPPLSPIYASPPHSPRDSSVGSGGKVPIPDSPNRTPEQPRKCLGPFSFNQDGHMRIIMGNGSPPELNKIKRNGIVTNPNLKNLGIRRQLKSALSPNILALKKETPL